MIRCMFTCFSEAAAVSPRRQFGVELVPPLGSQVPSRPCDCEGVNSAGWLESNAPLLMEPRKRLALSRGPALPGSSQTPRSPQHTSHIKRKQVTQMRQMVLVCDDSCNSLFSARPHTPLPPSLSAFFEHLLCCFFCFEMVKLCNMGSI